MRYSPFLISFLTNISRKELILMMARHEVPQRVAAIHLLAIRTIQSPSSLRVLRPLSSVSGLWGHSPQNPPPLQTPWQNYRKIPQRNSRDMYRGRSKTISWTFPWKTPLTYPLLLGVSIAESELTAFAEDTLRLPLYSTEMDIEGQLLDVHVPDLQHNPSLAMFSPNAPLDPPCGP